MNDIHNVHANIKPIKAWVREDVLYNMDSERRKKYLPCLLINISSYVNHALTFQILVDGFYIFNYVPPHLINLEEQSKFENQLGLNDLVYHNCPDTNFVINENLFLKNKDIYVFCKSENIWIKGSYLWSIDWYLKNDLLHAIQLNNGQMAFMPNHKICMKQIIKFPQFQKLKFEWKV